MENCATDDVTAFLKTGVQFAMKATIQTATARTPPCSPPLVLHAISISITSKQRLEKRCRMAVTQQVA
jgi:hypothetical protein